MSMCGGCREAADLTQEDRLTDTVMRMTSGSRRNCPVRLHPCEYPHSCTCQHDRTEPTVPERRQT